MKRKKKIKIKPAEYPDIIREIDKLGVAFDFSDFGERIQKLKDAGYLIQTEKGFVLTEKGIEVALKYKKELGDKK